MAFLNMKSILIVLTIIYYSLAVVAQIPVKLKATITLNGEIGDLGFSPDNSTLATTVEEKTEIRLWETNNGLLKANFSGNDDPFRRNPLEGLSYPSHFKVGASYFSFSPDGRFLAVAAMLGREVRVWRLDSGERYITIGPVNDMQQLEFSPDSKLLAMAAGEQGLRILDVSPRKLLDIQYNLRRVKTVFAARFIENGQVLMIGIESLDKRNTGMYYFEWKTGKLKAMVSRPIPLRPYEISLDGRRSAILNDNNELEITDPLADSPVITIRGFKAKVWDLEFSNDGRTVAIQCEDNSLKLWDTKSGILQSTIGVTEKVRILFSTKDNLVLTAGPSGLKLWDTKTGKLQESLGDSFLPVAFSYDGKLLATAGKKRTVLVWEVPNGE
jgi:WD40 repeat protein